MALIISARTQAAAKVWGENYATPAIPCMQRGAVAAMRLHISSVPEPLVGPVAECVDYEVRLPCLPQVAATARHLQFAFRSQWDQQCNVWSYGREQYNRLTHFLSVLRCGGAEGERWTVLELYLSYLASNGSHRFFTDMDEKEGAPWTMQLSHFRRALFIWQRLNASDVLVAAEGMGEYTDRFVFIGMPRLELVPLTLRLPQVAMVERFMGEACDAIMSARVNHTRNTEYWRAWCPGLPGSQMLVGGTLCDISPELKRVRTRLFTKSSVPTLPAMSDHEILQLPRCVQLRGLMNASTVKSVRTEMSKALQRAQILLDDLRDTSSNHHVVVEFRSGIRPRCIACQCTGWLQKFGLFRRQSCEKRGSISLDAAMRTVTAAMAQLRADLSSFNSHVRANSGGAVHLW
eukprot:6492060-Amphidinium_carterae.1